MVFSYLKKLAGNKKCVILDKNKHSRGEIDIGKKYEGR